ncbi:unnamed protein product [Sphagnum troendelagicum]
MSHSQFQYRNGQPYYNYPQYGQGMPRMDLKVIMCCEKCEEKVKEEIEELDGVQDVFTDQMRSSVVVYGYADSADVLRKAKKVHRKAELHSVSTSSAPYSAYDAAQLPYSHRRDHASSYITPRGISYPGGYSSRYEDSLRRDNYRPSYMDDNRHVYWPNHDYETSREYVRSAGNSYYRPSQDYPSRYDFDPNSGYYDSGMITNPNYLQPVRY